MRLLKAATSMNIQAKSGAVNLLERAGAEIGTLSYSAEEEVNAVAREFQGLAHSMDHILGLAAEIVGCIEDERVTTVLPKVQSLGEAARSLLRSRLHATAEVLRTVTAETELLGRLSQLVAGQSSIARETRTLSVVTSIEVARLGDSGASFQYLATELGGFSRSVGESTAKIAEQARERSTAIVQTRRMLDREVPRMESELAEIEAGMESALETATRSLQELGQAPDRFRGCVAEIATRIGEVITAIQGHDITRQQMEHVKDSLEAIATEARTAGSEGLNDGRLLARLLAGLRIQAYQLRNTREIVGSWLSQIRASMDGILGIGSSEVAEIGPLVLDHEGELAAQLEHIDRLEQACQAGSREVEKTLDVLATLAQLVHVHLTESKRVRDRLQLLSFNSIVEASHLGGEAAAILEISQNIKRISASWSTLTEQSETVMGQIVGLADETRHGMEQASEQAGEMTEESRSAAPEGLAHLHTVGATAARIGADIETGIRRVRDMIPTTAAAENRLASSFTQIGQIIDEVEQARKTLESEHPIELESVDVKEMEERYGHDYTTEVEREVLRAAVTGGELPPVSENMAGNEAELF